MAAACRAMVCIYMLELKHPATWSILFRFLDKGSRKKANIYLPVESTEGERRQNSLATDRTHAASIIYLVGRGSQAGEVRRRRSSSTSSPMVNGVSACALHRTSNLSSLFPPFIYLPFCYVSVNPRLWWDSKCEKIWMLPNKCHTEMDSR